MSDSTILSAVEDLRNGRVISGLADCHIPGVYSIVLRQRVDARVGMLRILYSTRDSLSTLERDGDFCVMPHNHRQDIRLYRLFGDADNVRMVRDGLEEFNEYEFCSAILGGDLSLKKRRTVVGSFVVEPISAYGMHLSWEDVHTVISEPESAWLVSERHIAPASYVSLCYSRLENKKLDPSGLYRKLEAEELSDVVGRLLKGIEKSKK